jgi:hypothetical protein
VISRRSFVSGHGFGAFGPVGRAHFAVLFGVLQGFNHAQGLVDIAAQGQVVDHLVLHNAFFVDQEEATESHAFVFFEHVKVAGDGFVEVGHQGVFNAFNPALGFGGVEPCGVGEVGVGRNPDYDGVAGREISQFVLEGVNFGGAHKGEVEGVEKQHHVFAEVVGQLEVINHFAFDNGFSGKIGSLFGNQGHSRIPPSDSSNSRVEWAVAPIQTLHSEL